MGGLGSLFGGGGGGGGGYRSPNLGTYEDATKAGALNLIGAKKKPDGTYDYSGVGNPITGAQGVKTANEGYDFSGIDKAGAGYGAGPKALTQTYNPANLTQTYSSGYKPTSYNASQFNYQTLPDKYFDQAYNAGSKDIRREGQGQLQQTQEAVGTRRPGLLLKAAQGNNRDIGERLAQLNTNLGLQRMQQGVDTSIQQQKDQAVENMNAAQFGEGQAQFGAGEGYKGYQSRSALENANADQGYKGYQSRADTEQKNADLSKDYLSGQLSAGQAKLGGQQANVANAQQDTLARMNYLSNLYGTTVNSQNQAAQLDNQKSSQSLGFLGSLGGAIAGGPVGASIGKQIGKIGKKG